MVATVEEESMKRWLSAATVTPVTLVLTLALTLVLTLAAGRAATARDPWVGVRGGLSIPRLSTGGNEVSSGFSSRLRPISELWLDTISPTISR